MFEYVSDVAFTPTVKRFQETKGSRKGYARMEEKAGWQSTVTDELANFIAERDSFYLGTANADGQPYIQHRGGKPGFLKVIDEKTLAFADFRGNRQYISAGNLEDNDKAYMFLMDYPNRRRIKIWGRARVVDDDADLLARLTDADYDGVPEQAVVFEITAWDVNCPQHITPRFTEEEVAEFVAPLQQRIKELEAALETKRDAYRK
jgi:predicted pyridoxine 5'-phosphate oxidase superfamily flavin-nucleotide-binding protein